MRQAADIASHVRPAVVTSKIRAFQWDKLSRVCLSVPTACAFPGCFSRRCVSAGDSAAAALALELFCGGVADGCNRRWRKEARQSGRRNFDGHSTGLERAKFKPWPPGIVDAYTADIRKGLPLRDRLYQQVVGDLGMRYRYTYPGNRAVLHAVHAVEQGGSRRRLDLLRRCLRRWCNNNIVCILALYPRIRKRMIFMQNYPNLLKPIVIRGFT